MLKVFRSIRRKLLEEKSLQRYLVYAVGEIVLVVIGILIALQINGWNEGRKDKIIEKEYLIGLQSDLVQDTGFLNLVFDDLTKRLSWFSQVDSSFKVKFQQVINQIPITKPDYSLDILTMGPRQYRPKVGTYNSLVSEGKSYLISNRELLNEIKNIYEVDMVSLKVVGGTLWDKSNHLRWERRYDIKYGNYNAPLKITDKNLLADLDNLYKFLNFYARQVNKFNNGIGKVLGLIELELKKIEDS